MKQPLLKRILMTAFCICIASTLFSALLPARTAHASMNRAATCTSGTTTNIGLGTIWYPGNQSYATACDGGQLQLTYQTDGNFVLYHSGHAIWSTSTVNNWFLGWYEDYAKFQGDGNLVVYQNTGAYPFVQAAWASKTSGEGATVMALQRDGNLVIYRSFTPLWSSQTNYY